MNMYEHMKRKIKVILPLMALFIIAIPSLATQRNIAPSAKVTVSDFLDDHSGADCLTDGIVRVDGRGEWACRGSVTPWGIMHLPWLQLEWDSEVCIDRIVIYDRASMTEHLAGGTLKFSDGTETGVVAIPNDGGPKEILFDAKKVRWVKFEANDGNGKDIGLSEIEVFEARGDNTDYVEWVDPYIETTQGRWFFCTPGGRPMGMIAAHAFTRNKNQGGGGYNYNFDEILGFTQINDWMISGINIMPVTGDVNPREGIPGWKSKFSHADETIQPGYHKLFLERYSTWVEYTATDRVAFYRMDYTRNEGAKFLVDAGSVLGNCSMDEAVLYKTNDNRIVGQLMTTERFWGGPDKVALFFALESDSPFSRVDAWNENSYYIDADRVEGDSAGMVLNFDLKEDSQVSIKIAMSYTSIENAIENLESEIPGWDFDKVRDDSRKCWNDMLGRIEVKGGTVAQKVKFYTDLWHVLLGRHKINDVNGFYPDYTKGVYVNKRTPDPMIVRCLPKSGDGTFKFNMYGFDALWLSQWNLNILWGLAWPEIVDDLSACLVNYASNGGMLPRGACAGGYSFIMTGCPATSLIVSAYMKDILTKAYPNTTYALIKKNHLPGGMMSAESSDDLKFYIKNGWCPDNAGKTLQWAFEDWGLSRMARKLGRKGDAREYERRSHGWQKIFDYESGFVFPKNKNGEWIHQDPLNGRGWVEANAWQATWSVSHDLRALVNMMGGSDAFCDKLNHAFEMAAPLDFVYAYSGGYVSYANQPGCSGAHLFSYGGKPWLTQYWVRRVKEQAYGGITPDKGYGGHDEDQGQMGGVSALMAMGLFSVQGTESDTPYYDITSPVFDEIKISLNNDYYQGREFRIKVNNNSATNCYIQKAELNGKNWEYSQFAHKTFAEGGQLELWLGETPQKSWGKLLYQ